MTKGSAPLSSLAVQQHPSSGAMLTKRVLWLRNSPARLSADAHGLLRSQHSVKSASMSDSLSARSSGHASVEVARESIWVVLTLAFAPRHEKET